MILRDNWAIPVSILLKRLKQSSNLLKIGW